MNPSHQCFSVTEEHSCLENQSLLPPWGSRERIILWNPGKERARNTRSLFADQLGGFHPEIWDVKEVTHPKNSSPSCRASLAHPVPQAHSQAVAGKSGDKSQSGRRWGAAEHPRSTWNSLEISIFRVELPELLCSLSPQDEILQFHHPKKGQE